MPSTIITTISISVVSRLDRGGPAITLALILLV
jgi:hypothetical protein